MLQQVLKQNNNSSNNNNNNNQSTLIQSNSSIDNNNYNNYLTNSNNTYSSAKSYLSEDFFSVTSNNSDLLNMSSLTATADIMINSDNSTPSIVDECQEQQRDNNSSGTMATSISSSSSTSNNTHNEITDDQYCTSSSISINNNPTNTPVQDGADIKNSRNSETNTSTSSLANSERELNWSALNNKMKSIDKLDLKRGSILIEHLSEYNKLASSQVILGEENLSESSNNTSEITDAVTVQLHVSPPPPSNNNQNQNQNNNNNNNLKQSQLDNIIMTGINLFNEKPKKGIEYFISHKLITKTPESVAEFLHLCPLLNKKSIGDYLGDIDQFSISTLESLISRFNFQDLDFDMALRQLLYCFRLPGEAQKIDRIMQRFANQFHKDNSKSVFEDPDAVYMLAFATILLNTDLHHPYIKPTMTKSKFAKSLYKINNGKDLPLEYLEDIYDRISVDEIKMDPTGALFPYAVKKGWLNIRVKGKVSDKWSRKWCVLSQGTLFFFRKPTDHTPVRYLRPDTVITPQKETKGKKNCFILNHSSPPICVESMLKNSSIGTKLPNKFNPQLLIQQLASFGKEKVKEPKFWDSISDKMYSDQKFDTLQEIVQDTDSVSSIDTLSETSSAYYDEDVSPASSISSTSPISNALHQKKKGFSLRLGNKKTKDQILSMSEETSTTVQFNQPSSNNCSPSLSRPPKPTTNTNTTNPPNHSLTQPRPTIYKTVSSSSLMRSSSISSFSLPPQPSSASSTPTKTTTTTTTTTTTSTTTSTTTTTNNGLPPLSSTLTTTTPKSNIDIDSLTKLQEKMIKSSSKRTNTCILNADTKRERDSWIRLILQEFTSTSKF